MKHPTSTQEERAARRRDYIREYMRKYRAEHPDREGVYRENVSANYLRRKGYTITPPDTVTSEPEV